MRALRLPVFLLCAALSLLVIPSALAAGTPNISASSPSNTVLFGSTDIVTLRSANPAGQPWGYNLTYRAVLPAGVTFVSNVDSSAPAPTIFANQPAVGQTTLVWRNVSDLSPNSSNDFQFRVAYDTTGSNAKTPGTTVSIPFDAYTNSDARYVPTPNGSGVITTSTTPAPGNSTGYASSSHSTQIAAIDLIQSSDNAPEGEILRGVHDNRVTYTIQVRNNAINPTTNAVVTEYLPAGQEWLGCGAGDNTTDAPTNPGSTREWAGAPALNATALNPTNCLTPTATTVQIDPDGAGPRPNAVYTRLVFNLGVLAANSTNTFTFVAGVPIRENTLDWNGAAAGLGTTPASASQASNLNNNSGPETTDEQYIPLYGEAAGLYNGTTATSDTDLLDRTAEDLRILKSNNNGAINQGQNTTWTLQVDISEYRYSDSNVVVDTLPNGLCPLSTPSPSPDAECGGATAGDNPTRTTKTGATSPFFWDSAIENADGSWTITWTLPQRLQPSDRNTITFHTKTRKFYQENGADAMPVYARDSWTNHVVLTGNDSVRCTTSPDCATGVRIAADETDGTPDTDVSSASQEAGSPTIDKGIQGTTTGLANCASGAFTDTPPGAFHVGDKVCYRLQMNFPNLLDTRNVQITDFLPPGTTYVPGSAQPLPGNTVSFATGPTVNGGTVGWTLAADTAAAQRFDVVLAVTVDQSPTVTDSDVTSNLMKVSYANTAGTTFPLRDQIDSDIDRPVISLTTGVQRVGNGPIRGANYDTETGVPTLTNVIYRVDVTNSGSQAAQGTDVVAVLPAGVNCTLVSSISNGGTCVAPSGSFTTSTVRWSGVAVAAAGSTSLTYTQQFPGSFSPSQPVATTAGVRSYQSATNLGGAITWTPSSNIDTSLEPNANTAPAKDPTAVTLVSNGLAVSVSTGVNETGNNLGTQATIGENIVYTGTVTVPASTTSYGTPTYVMRWPANLNYQGSTVTYNGSATLPSGWNSTVNVSARTVTVTAPTPYDNDSVADQLVFTVNTDVPNDGNNNRTNTKSGTGLLTATYTDQAGGTRSNSQNGAAVTIVEPQISTIINRVTGGTSPVVPNQEVPYTLTTSNSNNTSVSIAHETSTSVVIPAGLTLLTGANGTAVANGGTVAGGTYNATTRTLTFPTGDINPNSATTSGQFYVRVDNPAVSGSILALNSSATTTSHPGTPPVGTERTYNATSSATLQLGGTSIAKTQSVNDGAIGTEFTYNIAVTLQPNIQYYDLAVKDSLPSQFVFDALDSTTCTAGCASPSDIGAIDLANGQSHVFFIGDVAPSAQVRTVTLAVRGHVAAGTANGTFTNTASINSNATNTLPANPTFAAANGTYSYSIADTTGAFTVGAPVSAISKAVSGNALTGRIGPGETVTYTVTVSNSGNRPLYDTTVTDRPDSNLVAVTPVTGASLVTNGWNNPGDGITWRIPAIAAGSSQQLTYTARLRSSSGLVNAQAVNNTVSITQAYAVPESERIAYPANTYVNYAPRSASVSLTTALPAVTIAQTTGASGFPESSNAVVGQAFPWRIVVTNTSVASAPAQGVDVRDVLPADWTYVAGSAQLDGVAISDPTITGGATKTLDWTNLIANLPGGASRVVTFNAIPTADAALNRGTGAGNPHVANAFTTWDDASGASASQAGPYAAGPDPAQAVLQTPVADLTVTKTLASGSLTEGQNVTYQLATRNNGPNVALNVTTADTFPVNLRPDSVTGPCTISGQTVTCTWAQINNGTTNTPTVTAHVLKAAGGSIANTATVSAATSTDPTPGNNTSTTSNAVSRPQVSISKAVSNQIGPGLNTEPADTIDYALTISNAGAATAHDVVVLDQPSSRLTGVSIQAISGVTVDDGWTAGDPGIRWTIGSIPAGSSVTLTYTANTISGSGLSEGDTITNTASVPSYYAGSAAARAADPSVNWTQFTDGGSSSRTLTAHVPQLQTDLSTVSSGPAVVNAPYTLRIDSTNTNTFASANTATSTVTLPSGWEYISGSATGAGAGTVTSSGQTLTFTPGPLAPGQTKTVTFDVRPTPDAALNGTGAGTPYTFSQVLVARDSSASTGSADGPYRATDSVDLTIDNPEADVRAAKSLTGGTLREGENVEYTITVDNLGSNAALNVQAVDTLPTSLTPVGVNGAPCTIAGQTVTCDWPTIAAGSSRTVILSVHVRKASTGSISNRVNVTTTSDDPAPANNSATTTDPVVSPSLSISKTLTDQSGPGANTEPGDKVTYTLRVKNTGTSTAYDTVVADAPSANLTDVQIQSNADASVTDGWSAADRDLAWFVPVISAGQTLTLVYTATVVNGSGLSAGDTVPNTAAVPEYWQAPESVRVADPATDWTQLDGGDDAANATVHVPQLTHSITGPTANSRVNQPSTLSVMVGNTDSTATAYDPTLTVTLPVGWEYVSGSATGGVTAVVAGRDVVFTMPNVGPSSSIGFDFQATPTDDAAVLTGTGPTNPHSFNSTVVADDASGSASSADGPYTANDEVDLFIDNPNDDIATTIDVSSSTAVEGDTLTYTVRVENLGAESSLNVVSETTLPADVRRTGTLPSNCTQTGRAIRCTWTSVPVSQTRTYTIDVRVQPTPAATFDATTEVTTTSNETDLTNNNDSVSVTTQRPQMTIDKSVVGNSGSGSGTQPGDTYTYSIVLKNTGSSTAYDVVVEDTPPASITDVVATDGNQYLAQAWTPGNPTMGWLVNSIPAGGSVTLKYNASLVGGGSLSDAQAVNNTAQIDSYYAASTATRAAEPTFAWTQFVDGGSDSENLTVRLPQVTISNTTGTSGFPEIAPAEIGQPFTWRLAINAVATDADTQSTTVIDTLPPEWSYVPGSAVIDGQPLADPTMSGQTLTWSIGGLTSGQTRVIEFRSVPTIDARTQTNPATSVARVRWTDKSGASSSADGPYETGDDPAQADLVFPTLVTTKTVDDATVIAGTGTTYTVRVENTGDAVARNVTVADVLPSGMNYVPGSATSAATGFIETDGSAPTLEWTVPALAAGDALEIRVPVTLEDTIPDATRLTNRVSATSNERPDPSADSEDITSDELADVTLTKTGPTVVRAGQQMTWELTASNAGPSQARNVVITDPLPNRVQFVSATDGCTVIGVVGSQTVTCVLGNMRAGTSQTRQIVVRVLPGTLDPTVVNLATVSTDSPEGTATNNNDASNTVNLANAVDLSVTKTAAEQSVVQSRDIRWTITTTNKGPSDAFGVRVIDTLPAGVTPTSVTPERGTCTVAGQTVTCELGRINNLESVDVVIVARADTPGQKVNTVAVSSDPNTEITPADNTATSAVTVQPAADLAISKVGPSRIGRDAIATYSLAITNNGPSDAGDVVVTDVLPDGLTPTGATPSAGACSIDGKRVTCRVDRLEVGAGFQVALAARSDGSQIGQTVRNTASVDSAETDLVPTNNSSFAESYLSPTRASGDLTVTKTTRNTSIKLGEPVEFEVTVTNKTDRIITGVVAVDVPSAPVELISITPDQGSCKGLTCTLGTLRSDQAVRIRVVMRPLQVGPLENSVVVTGDGGDSAATDPANNQDDADLPVIADPTRFALTKRANRKAVKPGQRVTYTIVARNLGSAAADVRVCDRLPAGLSLVKAKGSKLVKGRICWTRTYVKAKGKLTFRVTTRVAKTRKPRLKNVVTLRADNVRRPKRAAATVRVRAPKSDRGGGVIG